MAEGQLISKAIYGLLPKNKWTNLFCLIFYSSQQTNQICQFLFWENLRVANLLFDLIWPLVGKSFSDTIMYFSGTFRLFLLYFSWTFIFFFFVSVELLEIQDQYAKDVIQYLQVLDPGRTWRKSQILSKLRAITTALAKVSCIIIFMTYFLLHIKNCKTNQWVSKKFLYRIYQPQVAPLDSKLQQGLRYPFRFVNPIIFYSLV